MDSAILVVIYAVVLICCAVIGCAGAIVIYVRHEVYSRVCRDRADVRHQLDKKCTGR